MAKTGFESVDEYISAQPPEVQAVLQRVRSILRKAVPAAVEVVSYNMPTFVLPGGPVLYLAAWKRHYSLYPATPRLIEALRAELAPYRAGKGTLRFPLSEPVPVELIERIARSRAEEVSRRRRPPERRRPRRGGSGSPGR